MTSDGDAAWSMPPLDQVGHVALRLGRLLLASGADTAHVRHCVESMASGLGTSSELFVSSDRLLLTVSSDEAYRTKLGHALPALGVNMGRLAALTMVAEAVARHEISFAEAGRRLDGIETSVPVQPGWLVVLAVASTMACLARMLGASGAVAAAAFLAGIPGTLLRRRIAAVGVNPFAGAFCTALVGGACGVLLLRAVPEASPTLCLVAAGMILVPGVPLINGISDLVRGHVEMALARLATGTVTVLAIAFGLFVAAGLAGDPLPVASKSGASPVAEDILLSGLAAFGYAMLFDVPRRGVWACILCGMAGHGSRTALEAAGFDLATATLAAAALAGLVARGAGRHLRMPWASFAFPGVVAMVPGSYAFRAGIGGLRLMAEGGAASPVLLAETLSLAITAVVVTAAIGTGLVLASLAQLELR